MKKSLLTTFAVFMVTLVWAAVPFKVTTIENGDFANGTTWYTMAIGTGAKIIKDNAGAEFISVGRATTQYAAEDLWCFVGNETDGYAVYNKQAGVTKVLASKTEMGVLQGYGGTGGTTYPTMQDAENLPNGYVGRWDFAKSDKIADVDGYFMKIHGTGYAVNEFGGIGKLAFWAEGADAGSTIRFTVAEATVEVLASTGSFTASNTAGTWHSVWSSTEVPGFTLSTGANNMTTSGDYIAGYSGQSQSSTYTLTAPEGMAVAGYSFDFVNTNNDSSYALEINIGGKKYTTSATVQSVAVEIEEPVRMATFTQTGANKGVTFSNFFVKIKPDVREPEPNFEVFPTPTSGAIPYRIPAIATASNGDIIAVADYRHSRADIGMATNGRIDLHARISKDNGKTWGEIFSIVDGRGAAGVNTPGQMYVGFGDPCIVADRESDRVLVVCCSGNVSFPNGQRNNHQGIAHLYSEDNGVTWSEPVDRSESIYSQFDNSPYGPVRAMFVGSGKISQSHYIKVGEYYRLYCAVLVKDVNGTHVNFVLYSDDFGEKWTVLGGTAVAPIAGGGADEPKAEELPDGSVILSSRTSGGRYYNIYSYTDSEKAEGYWGASQFSGSSNNGTVAVNNSTNGEVLFVPARRKADDKKVYLALQSVPFGSGRANVGIYYKELETLADFASPAAIAADWDGHHQSSYLSSAYSTMTLQQDNNIGFLYEEDTYGTSGGGYTIVYKNYSIEYLTDSAYVYDSTVDKHSIVAAGVEAKLPGSTANEVKIVGMVDRGAVEGLLNEYKETPSYALYEAINKAVTDAMIKVENGKWYRIRNTERSGGKLYLNPEASRVSTAESEMTDADQLFTFIPTGNEGEYYLYNGNYQYMLGPLGANETQPVVTTDKIAAGKWTISSSVTGHSSIICQNKTGANTGLHLAGDNKRLVPWTNNAAASLWYIELVEEFPLDIENFAAVCLPFAITIPEGVCAYVAGNAKVDNNTGVTVAPLTEYGSGVVAAKTPVVLVAENGTYMIGVGGEAEEFTGENSLHGVLKSTSVSGNNIYRLVQGEFVKRNASSGVVEANNAYYVQENEAATIVPQCGESTAVESAVATDAPVRYYDLKGNLVKNPTRGIYVTSEGGKVIVY